MNKSKATLYFSEMLLSLLKGKTSLQDALGILSSEGIEIPVREYAVSLLSIMKKGKNLSESLRLAANNKILFNPLYLSLITAAETTGNIEGVLDHIVRDLQRKQKLKENVLSVLIYPIIIILIAIIGTVIIIVKGFPLFVTGGLLRADILNDAVSGIIAAGFILLSGGCLLFIIYYRIFYHDSPEYTIFYILNLMLRGNVALPQAVSYCIISIKDIKYGKALVMIKKDMTNGVTFSSAFAKTGCFSNYVTGWLSVADVNGNIVEICENIKTYYERKDLKKRAVAARLIEPAVILLTGIYILVIMLTVVLPILTYSGGII